MCSREAARCTWIVNSLALSDEPGRLYRPVLDWNVLVVFTKQDSSKGIDLLKIVGEIGVRGGLDAVVGILEACLHTQQTELIRRALGDFFLPSYWRHRKVPPGPCRIASGPL